MDLLNSLTSKTLYVQLNREEARFATLTNSAELINSHVLPTPAGAVYDGEIQDVEAIQALLKKMLRRPEYKDCRKVVFSLSTSRVAQVTEDQIPNLPAKNLEKLIQANKDMYFKDIEMKDYKLQWQIIAPKMRAGQRELQVQLWAVPLDMLVKYYEVANGCGLSVAQIDYCGSSIAAALGASFTRPTKVKVKEKVKLSWNMEISLGKKKDAEQPEEEEEELPAAEQVQTQLHIFLDNDLLGATFVQNGQVVQQRFISCGANPSFQFYELAMMVEFFRSTGVGRGSRITGFVSGGLADDAQLVAELGDILGITLNLPEGSTDPKFTLCIGAGKSSLDFGVPAMNVPRAGHKSDSQTWQWIAVGVAALLLIGSVVVLLSSRLGWTSEKNKLQNEQQLLLVQVKKTSGYKEKYDKYQADYKKYSDDWETIFNNLRTYNDNLVLMIDELEHVLPKDTSITRIEIADDGLAVSLASPSKEQAAYTIKTLRGLQYADFITVSSLLQYSNPYYPEDPGAPYDPSLPYDPHNYNFIEAYQRLFGSYEPAPTVGSGEYDILLDILIQSSKDNNGNANINDLIQDAIDQGLITEDQIEDLINGDAEIDYEDYVDDLLASGEFTPDKIASSIFELTPDEFNALEDAYARVPEIKYDLDDLLEDATFTERKAAMSTMLNNDPVSMYRFFNLFKVDMNRPAKECVLDSKIYDGIWENTDKLFPLLNGDMSGAEESIPVLVGLLVQDDDCLSSAEKLMREDKRLEDRYAFYLALEMDKISLDDFELPVFDPEDILKDFITGDLPEVENPEDLEDALDSILPDLDIDLDDILKPNNKPGNKPNDKPNSKPSNKDEDKDNDKPSLEDILAGLVGDKDNPNSDSKPDSSGGSGSDDLPDWFWDMMAGNSSAGTIPQQPVDERYHYKVALGYKDALILAEQERKGLVGADKVAELEVDA